MIIPPAWKAAAAVAVVLGLMIWAYGKGVTKEATKCAVAEITAERDALKRDVDAAKQSEQDAAARARAADQARKSLNEKVAAYEASLKSRANGQCLLDDADVDMLRELSR